MLNKAKPHASELIVMGAVTKNSQGEDLTEILDMHYQSGLRFFLEMERRPYPILTDI
ncbi:hypothetical protein [Algoriphagus boritolerans]|uniref:hypothetical protein n=1 Tax=Algoriphagus boritolerans TaxID=308111 RepID=UPI000AE2B6FA